MWFCVLSKKFREVFPSINQKCGISSLGFFKKCKNSFSHHKESCKTIILVFIWIVYSLTITKQFVSKVIIIDTKWLSKYYFPNHFCFPPKKKIIEQLIENHLKQQVNWKFRKIHYKKINGPFWLQLASHFEVKPYEVIEKIQRCHKG